MLILKGLPKILGEKEQQSLFIDSLSTLLIYFKAYIEVYKKNTFLSGIRKGYYWWKMPVQMKTVPSFIFMKELVSIER